jgi:hypothetical protein
MQHHQIASLTRSTALMACVAALVFALAGSAQARPETQLSENSGAQAQPAQPTQLSEHGGQQAQPPASTSQIVGDTPSDRVSPTPAPPASGSSTTTSDDGSDNAPLIVGLSLLTVALLGSGMYVARRRRHVAPGH